jgi:tol-pal system beta propeller repeat protein TolB
MGRAWIVLAVAVLALVGTAIPAHGAYPGKNGKVAAAVGFPYQVHTMNPDGTGLTQVTDNPDQALSPSWSPDGRRIAFHSEGENIYVVNADGTGLTQITNTPHDEYSPTWSPDGKRIAFSANPASAGSFEIIIVNADGTGLVNASHDPGDDQAPAWSPDGSRIAFSSRRNGSYGIYTMNVDGTDVRQLMSSPFVADDPDWSPNGSRLTFTSVQADWHQDRTEIFSIKADGTDLRNLTNSERYESASAWSPDGRKILFAAFDPAMNNEAVHSMNPDGSGVTVIGEGTQPSWQPLPPPQRSEYRNANRYCKALRGYLGPAEFKRRYGKKKNCVRANR